jgi:hypothetical protein
MSVIPLNRVEKIGAKDSDVVKDTIPATWPEDSYNSSPLDAWVPVSAQLIYIEPSPPLAFL